LRDKLKEKRVEFELSQSELACIIGISVKHYQAIEQGRRFPSEYVLQKLLKTLNSQDLSLLENVKTNKRGEVSKNICNYMNERATHQKEYSIYEVNAIRKSISLELIDRKRNKLIIKKTEIGKKEINKRIADIANKTYKTKLTHEDVKLWRICCRDEYTDRTGKCTWGIPEVRRKLGFNSITGHTLKD
jgi:transcriptional regulator with XRE-family HTH domain